MLTILKLRKTWCLLHFPSINDQPVTDKRSVRATLVPIHNSGIRGKCDKSREQDSDILLLFCFSNYLGAHDHSSQSAFSKQHAKHIAIGWDGFDKMDSHYTCTAFAKHLKQPGLVFQHLVLFKVAQKCITQLAEKKLTFSLESFHGLVSNPVACHCHLRTWKKSRVSNTSK